MAMIVATVAQALTKERLIRIEDSASKVPAWSCPGKGVFPGRGVQKRTIRHSRTFAAGLAANLGSLASHL